MQIHGLVLPDGTAVLRPVELAIMLDRRTSVLLRRAVDVLGPARGRSRGDARRGSARRRAPPRLGYRGAFGIDGVLTADGFRPTEFNTRVSAGLTQATSLDRKLFGLLQAALVLGLDPGLGVADLESLLPIVEAEPCGRSVARAKEWSSATSPRRFVGRRRPT